MVSSQLYRNYLSVSRSRPKAGWPPGDRAFSWLLLRRPHPASPANEAFTSLPHFYRGSSFSLALSPRPSPPPPGPPRPPFARRPAAALVQEFVDLAQFHSGPRPHPSRGLPPLIPAPSASLLPQAPHSPTPAPGSPPPSLRPGPAPGPLYRTYLPRVNPRTYVHQHSPLAVSPTLPPPTPAPGSLPRASLRWGLRRPS